MSTVAPAVAIAIQQAAHMRASLHSLATVRDRVIVHRQPFLRGLASRHSRASSSATTDPNLLPLLLLALVVVFFGMVTRVNTELVNIFSQLIRTAAAVGRMLLLMVVIGVLALIVLLHL